MYLEKTRQKLELCKGYRTDTFLQIRSTFNDQYKWFSNYGAETIGGTWSDLNGMEQKFVLLCIGKEVHVHKQYSAGKNISVTSSLADTPEGKGKPANLSKRAIILKAINIFIVYLAQHDRYVLLYFKVGITRGTATAKNFQRWTAVKKKILTFT